MSDTISLQDRMDAVGWADPSQEDYRYLCFQWMREATSEIRRLSLLVDELRAELAGETEERHAEVASLTRMVNSRTEHLA